MNGQTMACLVIAVAFALFLVATRGGGEKVNDAR